MTATRQILAAMAVVGVGITILACQDTTSTAPEIVPATTGPAPATQKALEPPTSIIKMQKPKMLGPVTPAVIALPAGMGEPVIRVRLTGESTSPPAVKKTLYRGRV